MMQRLGSNISRRAARINGANADSEYDLHHMASMIACLTKAVALDKQGVLAPRQRIAATRALEWLVQFAKRSMAGEVVTSLAMDESIAVRVALVQVYSLAMLAVSEAGGAASAAASHNHPAGSQRAHVSLHTGSARTGAGWVETLQYSSELIHSVLNSKQLADPPPSPDPLPNGGPNGNGQAAVNRNFRCACFKLAAALLRSDAIASLSRLLAAEEHRGTFFAVLGTGATVDILRPLLDLVRISRRAPTEVLSFGDRQQELLCPAVLRALAVSGVVEHVCRFAVTRLVDPGRGTGRAAYQYHEHASCVRGLVEEVSLLACKALAQGWGDPADTWTVLMSPCFQYLVHLHVVSQLHALDGGTTYGLPYGKLMPPAASRKTVRESGDSRPVVLSAMWILAALNTWRVRFSVPRPRACGAPPLLRPRMVVKVVWLVRRSTAGGTVAAAAVSAAVAATVEAAVTAAAAAALAAAAMPGAAHTASRAHASRLQPACWTRSAPITLQSTRLS